ncbi:AMP nucleosidase [Burkholderia multivorans]
MKARPSRGAAKSPRPASTRIALAPRKPLRRRRPAAQPTPPGPAKAALSPRVRRLIASPAYLPADEDAGFLQQPDMCGVRLQLDYWKTESRLQRLGITDTVVVYGSTRIVSSSIARRRLADAQRALAARPNAPECLRAVHTATRLLERSGYYEVARELGNRVGRTHDCAPPTLHIITGGGPGIMEAANRGAHEACAPSIGLNISLPHEQFPNPYVTPELCFRFHYFAIRKLHLLERARAAVFFPGGYGTCDELFEVLTLLQTGKIAPLPVVLVGESFWRAAIHFDFLVDEGMISPEDLALFTFCETADEIWSVIGAHDATRAARAAR